MKFMKIDFILNLNTVDFARLTGPAEATVTLCRDNLMPLPKCQVVAAPGTSAASARQPTRLSRHVTH